MTGKQIARIFNGAGMDINGNYFPKLRTLIMTTNHGIDPHRDRITFDLSDGLIYIKQYSYTAINGKIINAVLADDKKTLTSNIGPIFIVHPVYNFRSMRNGDLIISVDKKTGATKKLAHVVSCSMTKIVLDTEISYDKNKESLCYTTDKLFENAVSEEDDYTLLFKYTPMSDNEFDICLDIDFLVGIETVNRLVGLS